MFTALFAIFFLVLGLIGMIIPFSPYLRTEVVDFILSNTLALAILGFFFFAIGLGALIQLSQAARRHYFTLKRKAVDFDVSEKVILDYLSLYFRDLFPNTEVSSRVILKKNKVKIIADLPFFPKLEQESLVKKIEEDLVDILRELIGYPHELLLSISFNEKHVSPV